MGARKRGRRCIPPRASPPALSPCANHGSLSQTYIIPGLPSFPPPLPCRPSRAPAPSQCSWNPYSPKAHPRSSLAMRSRSFSSVRACSCDHECVGYGLIGASVALHTAGIYTIFFTFALIILTVYKRPLPVDWNMVVATAVLYVACMAVSLTICAIYATPLIPISIVQSLRPTDIPLSLYVSCRSSRCVLRSSCYQASANYLLSPAWFRAVER